MFQAPNVGNNASHGNLEQFRTSQRTSHMRSSLPSLEHTVALVYFTLPQHIYRAFDLRFKVGRTEEDDGEYELNISIIGSQHLRIYYYHAESGSEQSINGNGSITSELLEGSLREMFVGMTGLDRWNAQGLAPVEGLNKAVDLVFSTLPKNLSIEGHETKLSIHVGPRVVQGPYDIVYFDPLDGEVFFTNGEALPALTMLTAEVLLEDLKRSFR